MTDKQRPVVAKRTNVRRISSHLSQDDQDTQQTHPQRPAPPAPPPVKPRRSKPEPFARTTSLFDDRPVGIANPVYPSSVKKETEAEPPLVEEIQESETSTDKIIQLKETVKSLMNAKNYTAASKLLKQSFEEKETESDIFLRTVDLIECYFEINSVVNAHGYIKKLTNQIKDEFTPLVFSSLGKLLIQDEKYVRSFLYFICEGELHMKNCHVASLLKTSLLGIITCISNCNEVVGRLDGKYVTMSSQVIIPRMIELKEFIEEVTLPIPENARVINCAWALNSIAASWNKINENARKLECYQVACDNLEEKLKDAVWNHRVYGISLNNVGMAYEEENNLSGAYRVYERSSLAKKTATDWPDENIKLNSIKISNDNFLRVQKALGIDQSKSGNQKSGQGWRWFKQ